MQITRTTRRGTIRAGMSVAILALGLGVAPHAQAQPGPDGPSQADTMEGAMERDLGLSTAEVTETLEQEADASAEAVALKSTVGAEFAGAYITPGSPELTVAVTDESAAAEVRDAGATPVVVTRSQDKLYTIQADVDSSALDIDGVTSTYVDIQTNTVIVTATPKAVDEATASIEAADLDSGAVRVVETAEQPRTMASYRGGDAYFNNARSRCSVGFAVTGSTGNAGFVTAGHCGDAGDPITNTANQASGSFVGSSFPGNDYAVVKTNGNFTGTGNVAGSGGGNVAVRGSTPAATGAAVCRSGSTTGWQCGRVQTINTTVNYPEGAVSGVTQSTACAEGGDSGGSWLAGNQAQGVTSGGSGDCTSGGTTFFQPVNEILDQYQASLVTN